MDLERKGGATSLVIGVLLELTQNSAQVEITEISSKANISENWVREILANDCGLVFTNIVSTTPAERFRIALIAAQKGSIKRATNGLTWQEFERFTEECLLDAGFDLKGNLRFKGTNRRWQIDVVAARNDLLLVIDCKHWKPPNYLSKFEAATHHSKASAVEFLKNSKMKRAEREQFVLPIILTLDEPPSTIANGVVLIPILKLADFLQHVSVFDSDLPFIHPGSVVENPIKNDSARGVDC